MKKYLILLILTTLFISCHTQSKIINDMPESLVCHHYKILENGYFSFLLKDEVSFRVLRYHYSINKNANTILCSALPEESLDLDSIYDYRWKTSESFKRSHIGTWREQFFNRFSDNFLDLPNDEKLLLFEKLSKQ